MFNNYHAVMLLTFLVLAFAVLGSKRTVVLPYQKANERDVAYRYVDENITTGVFHTFNLSTPFVADAMIYEDKGWKLLVIISATQLPQKKTTFRGDFLLLYDGKYIKGERKLHEQNLLMMKYHLPQIANYSGSIVFTIVNNDTKLYYPDCSARILPHHVKQGIATCSMATNFDSFYDIANFISFNLFAGVNTVIIYCSRKFTYIPVLHFLFGKRLKIVYFLPTRDKFLGHYDVLIAQLNSCYYRNRDRFKSLIMIDLDELLFNHTSMTLIDLIDSLFSSSKYRAIHVTFNAFIHT